MNDIVWLHGLYECKEVFANQVDGETMSQHFRQIAIDLPGHGGSDNTPDSYSISGSPLPPCLLHSLLPLVPPCLFPPYLPSLFQ